MGKAITITDVEPEDVDRLWPFVLEHLDRALACSQHEFELEDIKFCLEAGFMRLWIGYNEERKIVVTAVTEIRQYPKKKLCFIILLGGEDMNAWLSTTAIEQWAKENGAYAIAAYVRRGFARKLKEFEFKEVYTVVQKDLELRRLH